MNAVKTEFAEAAERHLDDVHAYLVYLTGDRATAEELTAETFARALERWHRFDARRAGPRTWLCQLARSTALDHFRAEARRRRREGRYAAAEPSEAAQVFGEGLSPELEARARPALGGRARGRRAARRARARRRGRRARARDQRDGVLDAAQPRPAEAGEGGERRCRRLSSSVTSISWRRSCAPRGPWPRRRCVSAWPHSARPSPPSRAGRSTGRRADWCSGSRQRRCSRRWSPPASLGTQVPGNSTPRARL